VNVTPGMVREANSWDGEVHLISIFKTIKFLNIDPKNILTLLLQMANFIKNRNLKGNVKKDLPQLEGFG